MERSICACNASASIAFSSIMSVSIVPSHPIALVYDQGSVEKMINVASTTPNFISESSMLLKRKRDELEEDAEEDEPSYGKQILPVANLPDDFDEEPVDGMQYLFTVR